MCVSPVLIKNPNFGLKVSEFSFRKFKDCTSEYIKVPCGHCFECVSLWKMRLVQRAQMMSKFNVSYFLTFTYNNESLPSIDVNGFNIKYADIHDVQNTLKRVRKVFDKPFKYLLVSERGSKKGRPHFHLILWFDNKYFKDFNDKISFESVLKDVFLFNWSRNVGTRKNPIYVPICSYIQKFRKGRLNSTFDCHLITFNGNSEGSSDVVYYVTKYMLKRVGKSDSLQQALKLNLDSDEYSRVWNIVKDKCVYSKDFGLRNHPAVIDYIRKSIEFSKADPSVDYPCFIDCESGKLVPLCDFYKKLLTFDDLDFFYNRNRLKSSDVDCNLDTLISDERNYDKVHFIIDHQDKVVNLNELLSSFDDSDFLFSNS